MQRICARAIPMRSRHSATPPRVSEDQRLLACTGFDVEMRVLALPFVQSEYRVARMIRVAADYEYVVLLRERSIRAHRDR